jgi:hypothetical protein
MTTVNIEQIMQEIRADIVAKGYKNDIVPFEQNNICSDIEADFDMNLFENALNKFEIICSVNTHPAISSRGGVAGRLSAFVKRVLRKCINFHITPIVWSINEINNKSLEMFRHTRNFIKGQSATDERLTLLELELSRAIKKNNVLMEQKIEKLTEENKMLKKLLATKDN